MSWFWKQPDPEQKFQEAKYHFLQHLSILKSYLKELKEDKKGSFSKTINESRISVNEFNKHLQKLSEELQAIIQWNKRLNDKYDIENLKHSTSALLYDIEQFE